MTVPAPTPLRPLDILLHKRDGIVLTEAEIQALIAAIVQRTAERPLVSDAQIGAFLMAVFLRGLTPGELAALTQAMRFSGETFHPEALHTLLIDKHSTGGVGDKTSLLIAPILAAAGLARRKPDGVPGLCVPMISGRSLGHTGGTLDKLESISGFNTQLSLIRLEEILRDCGAALIGQTPSLVPADRILYALRDHTGTVESPFLIAASIMSKKLAESLDALVLDVKTGSGAFMPRLEDARLLARLMVETGEAAGTRTVALITNHDEPLGRFAGNWLEVQECVEIMQGRRHPMSGNLLALTLTLSGWMLHLAGQADTPELGHILAKDLLDSGAAYKAWLSIVSAQGGDTAIFTNPASFHKPIASRTLRADTSGFLAYIHTAQVGWAIQRLGAGRLRPGGPVSAHAGIEVHARLGDQLATGQPVFTLFTEEPAVLNEAESMLRAAFTLASTPPAIRPTVQEIVSSDTLRALKANQS